MEIKIKLLPGGKMPTKTHRTDAAWDCYARHDTTPSDVSHVKDTFKVVPAVLVDIREALCKECAQKEGK